MKTEVLTLAKTNQQDKETIRDLAVGVSLIIYSACSAARGYLFIPAGQFPIFSLLFSVLSLFGMYSGIRILQYRNLSELVRFPAATSVASLLICSFTTKAALLSGDSLALIKWLPITLLPVAIATGNRFRMKNGQPPMELPSDLKHFGFIIKNRYVTDLKWDFWLLSIWSLVPVFFTLTIWVLAILHLPYSLNFFLMISVASLMLLFGVRSLFRFVADKSAFKEMMQIRSGFLVFSLGCWLFGIQHENLFSTFTSFAFCFGLANWIFEHPLEVWFERNSKRGRDEYESLQGAQIGL